MQRVIPCPSTELRSIPSLNIGCHPVNLKAIDFSFLPKREKIYIHSEGPFLGKKVYWKRAHYDKIMKLV